MIANNKTYNLKITRHEMCDLLLALDYVCEEAGGEKWLNLHNKVLEQLEKQDVKNGYATITFVGGEENGK